MYSDLPSRAQYESERKSRGILLPGKECKRIAELLDELAKAKTLYEAVKPLNAILPLVKTYHAQVKAKHPKFADFLSEKVLKKCETHAADMTNMVNGSISPKHWGKNADQLKQLLPGVMRIEVDSAEDVTALIMRIKGVMNGLATSVTEFAQVDPTFAPLLQTLKMNMLACNKLDEEKIVAAKGGGTVPHATAMKFHGQLTDCIDQIKKVAAPWGG